VPTPSRKYAHLERERRFLPVRRVDVSYATRRLTIDDHLDGTRVRVRSIREEGGARAQPRTERTRLPHPVPRWSGDAPTDAGMARRTLRRSAGRIAPAHACVTRRVVDVDVGTV
jgi:hypothetical protein